MNCLYYRHEKQRTFDSNNSRPNGDLVIAPEYPAIPTSVICTETISEVGSVSTTVPFPLMRWEQLCLLMNDPGGHCKKGDPKSSGTRGEHPTVTVLLYVQTLGPFHCGHSTGAIPLRMRGDVV